MGPNSAWDLKTNSRGTQTDLVTDRNIAECLMELKSTPEFQGLAYRICETCNGEVTLMVTRSDGVGLLGVPLDPVTVIVTSGGLCYIKALFAPLEVVNLKPNGHFALRLFRKVLQKLNGRTGFGFCPGFKVEDFPADFQFRKHGFELIRQPYTRVHAKGCPVFFQQRKPRPGGRELGLELCSRCLQIGMDVCEALKEGGSEEEMPGLLKSLTKNWCQMVPEEPVRPPLAENGGPDLDSSDIESDTKDTEKSPLAIIDTKNSKHKKTPGRNHKQTTSSGSTGAVTSPSPSPTSQEVPPASSTMSHNNHVKQPNGVPEARIKPFRTVTKATESVSDTFMSYVVSGSGELVENGISLPILRLKRCDSGDPLMSSPSTLYMAEDAETDTLELAIDKEPDVKRPCIQCLHCSETLPSQSSLRVHYQQTHHMDPETADNGDPLTAEPLLTLQPTEDIRSVQLPHKTCPVCKQQFIGKEELEMHLRERHNTRLHKCRYCGQKFALKSNLSSHLLSHMGSAHLKCQECGAKYSNRKKYAEHIRQHMGSLPFFCKICMKHFSREKTYDEHMERHKTRRTMKSLVGMERMTHGIMGRARRCLEDKVQLGLTLCDRGLSSSAEGLPENSVKSDHDLTASSGVENAESKETREALTLEEAHSKSLHSASSDSVCKDSLCASSNLHLLSAVSLAQAELDQVYTSQTSEQEAKVADLQGQQQEEARPGSVTSARNSGTAALSASPTATLGDLFGSITSREYDKEVNKGNEASSPILQRLTAPAVSLTTAVTSACSHSYSPISSVGSSPLQSQNSPSLSQADLNSGDSRQTASEGHEETLREIEDREKKVLQKELELKEREVALMKKNMVLFQQLLLAKSSQQQRHPGADSVAATPRAGAAATSPARGLIPPRLLGFMRGMGPLPDLLFRAPGAARFPVPPGPRATVPHTMERQQDRGNDKSQLPLSVEGGAVKRQRPMTTPTPPPPDAAPNLLAPSIATTVVSKTAAGPSPSTPQTLPSGFTVLQELMRLESKLPESAKQFLPSSAKRKQPAAKPKPPVFHNYFPPESSIPSTVLSSATSPGHRSITKQGPSTSLPLACDMVAEGQPGWSGGLIMGKEKLGPPMMIVPPSEMKRILSLAEHMAPPPGNTDSTTTSPASKDAHTESDIVLHSSVRADKTCGLPADNSFRPLANSERTLRLSDNRLHPPSSEMNTDNTARFPACVDRTQPSTLRPESDIHPVMADKTRRPMVALTRALSSRPKTILEVPPCLDRSPYPSVSSDRMHHSLPNPELAGNSPANALRSPSSTETAKNPPDSATRSVGVARQSRSHLPIAPQSLELSQTSQPLGVPVINPQILAARMAVVAQMTATAQANSKKTTPQLLHSAALSPPGPHPHAHLRNTDSMLQAVLHTSVATTRPHPQNPVSVASPTVIHNPAIAHSLAQGVLNYTSSTAARNIAQTLLRSSISQADLHAPPTTVAHMSPQSSIVLTSPQPSVLQTSPQSTVVLTSPQPTVLQTSPQSTIVLTSPQSTVLQTSPQSISVQTLPQSTVVQTFPQSIVVQTSPKSVGHTSAHSVSPSDSNACSITHSDTDVASTRPPVPYGPPPLYFPNAAGGLPFSVPVPGADSDNSTPIDLTKPAKKNSDIGKPSDSEKPSVDLTSYQSALLRQYLLSAATSGRGDVTDRGGQNVALSSTRMSPLVTLLSQTVGSQHSQMLQTHAQALPPAHMSTRPPMSSAGPAHIPVSYRGPTLTHPQAVQISSQFTGSSQGPVSSQDHAQMTVLPGTSAPQQVPGIQPGLVPHGVLPHGMEVQNGPVSQVMLTRIDGIGVPVSLALASQVDSMNSQRLVMPSQGLPAQGLLSLHGLRSPPDGPARMSPPGAQISLPPNPPEASQLMLPPNFLLPATRQTDAGTQAEKNLLDKPSTVTRQTDAGTQAEKNPLDNPSTVPLGGFTWHRPVAVKHVHDLQPSNRQDSGTNTNSLRLNILETSDEGAPAVEFVGEDSSLSTNAWQKQFLQTLKKQRRHQEQRQHLFDSQQQQLVHRLQLHSPQQQPRQQQPAKPRRRGRPKKKQTDDPQSETGSQAAESPTQTTNRPSKRLLSPPPSYEDAVRSLQIGVNGSTTEAGNTPLLDMPVIADDPLVWRPRKRQSRKQKQTTRVDINAVMDDPDHTDEGNLVIDESANMQLEHTDDAIRCDNCGKLFLSEADILHHECGDN